MEQLCARLILSGTEGPRDPDFPEIRAHLPDVRLKGGPEFWGCPPTLRSGPYLVRSPMAGFSTDSDDSLIAGRVL
jgi:hypothetical protein